ncbi:MAG: DUF354 domain-containing protein [Bacteroidota bacterium]
MKVLIDIGHPGDFYLFKNLANELLHNGNQVLFTIREAENESDHAKHFGFSFKLIGKKGKGVFGKIKSVFTFTVQIIFVSLEFKPTLFLSHGSLFAGIAAFIFRKPHIAMEDTGNMEQIRLSKPFSNVILSPDVLPIYLGKKHIKFNGYHELCYLSPKYFKQDDSILADLGVSEKESFAIIRFTSWNATHDLGKRGLNNNEKIKLIEQVSSHMKVFISAENELPANLEPLRIKIPVTKMHDALYFARIYIGEGATMAAEAGILGTPSIYISPIEISYNIDQEKYGTVYNFLNYNAAKYKIEELILDNNSKLNSRLWCQKITKDKIDVNSFYYWFVENWPNSFKIMKENPDYQYNFK